MELLAPVGDKGKLKTALLYGADAVYLAGKVFGLRSAAENFTLMELDDAVEYTHKLNKKVYLALNTFPTYEEMELLANYLKSIACIDLDALIIADAGVVSLAQELTPFRIHLSTQASTTNIHAVKFWSDVGGISRVILGREVSIREAELIVKDSDIEVELFVHGSMCMSYSGKCTISNYTSDRDANRGGCTNSCRWEYSLSSISGMHKIGQTYVMNSKDLMGIERVSEMFHAGIHSLKIEGRMKSHFYLATVTSVYRKMIDTLLKDGGIGEDEKAMYAKEFSLIPNREYTDGFLGHRAGYDSVVHQRGESKKISNYVGIIREVNEDFVLLQVKNPFVEKDTLLFHLFGGKKIAFVVESIQDINWEVISRAQANSLVFLDSCSGVERYCVVSMGE